MRETSIFDWLNKFAPNFPNYWYMHIESFFDFLLFGIHSCEKWVLHYPMINQLFFKINHIYSTLNSTLVYGSLNKIYPSKVYFWVFLFMGFFSSA